jgi:hypothetical protein
LLVSALWRIVAVMAVRLAIILAILAVAACERQTPRLSGREIDAIRRGSPGMSEECLQKIRTGGIEALPEKTDACFEMIPKGRWRGLWRDDFEGSRFCQTPSQECSYKTPGDHVWLSWNTTAPRGTNAPRGLLYAIVFDGRQTRYRGNFGHMGMSQHEIIVDRLVSVAPVK